MGNNHDGHTALIPHITLSINNRSLCCHQIKPTTQVTFAMIITVISHRVQGQTITHIGIDRDHYCSG